MSVRSTSNWNLEVLVLKERGKLEYLKKNLSEERENQQQTQHIYGIDTKIPTRATLVGG